MAKNAKNEKNSKQFADQFDDEEVLYMFRKHPIVMRKGLIFGSLALLLGTVPALINPDMAWFFGGLGLGFVLATIVFLPHWIAWYYSVYIITDQRFIQISRKGLFSKTVVDMSLNQIQSMNYQVKGLQATLLGFGTMIVQTYMGDLVIHEVHHPAKVQNKITHILRDLGIEAKSINEPEEEKD